MISRRRFLQSAALSWPVVSGAVEPIVRSGPPRLRLGLAAYSFRDSFRDPAKMDFMKFLDFCAAHGCDGAELTSYYFPADVSDAMLLAVRRHAFLRGVSVTGTAVGNTFALPDGPELEKEKAGVRQWIDRAAVLGAPHIRVFAGSAKGIDEAAARKQVIRSLEELGSYAATKGVWLGVENHGGVVATPDGLLEIVRAVQSPAEELYDLRKDPAQLVNVATQPDYASQRRDLAAQLERELKAAGDPRVSGDGQTFEREPFTGLPKPAAKPKRAK